MTHDETFFNVYRRAFSSGLVRELGGVRWAVLQAIASYMNNEGEASPSQQQIANDVGLTARTVRDHLKFLLEFRFNEQPILAREIKKSLNNAFNYSYYKVLPVTQITAPDLQSEGVSGESSPLHGGELPTNYISNNITNDINSNNSNTVFNTPKDVIDYFCKKYQETYGANCFINWGRDASLVKRRLLSQYTPEQIQSIIDVIFLEYDKRWKSQRYQRPTIGALVTWMANEALAILEASQIPDIQEHGGYTVDEIVARIQFIQRRGKEGSR